MDELSKKIFTLIDSWPKLGDFLYKKLKNDEELSCHSCTAPTTMAILFANGLVNRQDLTKHLNMPHFSDQDIYKHLRTSIRIIEDKL